LEGLRRDSFLRGDLAKFRRGFPHAWL